LLPEIVAGDLPGSLNAFTPNIFYSRRVVLSRVGKAVSQTVNRGLLFFCIGNTDDGFLNHACDIIRSCWYCFDWGCIYVWGAPIRVRNERHDRIEASFGVAAPSPSVLGGPHANAIKIRSQDSDAYPSGAHGLAPSVVKSAFLSRGDRYR
jgi:hypothetical protein